MFENFVRVGSVSPEIKVGDVCHNAEKIVEAIKDADAHGVEVLVFPELALTGSTAGDLFHFGTLLGAAMQALLDIAKKTENTSVISFIGLPVSFLGRLYDSVAAISCGKILGFTAKSYFASFGAGAKSSIFTPFSGVSDNITVNGVSYPIGDKLVFTAKNNEKARIGVVIGGENGLIVSSAKEYAEMGANLVVNPCCDFYAIGRTEKVVDERKVATSFGLGLVYSNAGRGESSTDLVFSGEGAIFECGKRIEKSEPFSDSGKLLISEIDLSFVETEKRRLSVGEKVATKEQKTIEFTLKSRDGKTLFRNYSKTPFCPNNPAETERRAELILKMQTEGLKKRFVHAGAKTLVLGLSGGLDSTLALIVCSRVIKDLKRSPKDVIAITMPCFGTTSRTYLNTIKLAKAFGATLKKIDISKSVTRHLKDIKHGDGVFDAAFENSQARERTQVVMDVANMNGGIAVGTGDLSELALGWATYNGDHMSMYGVNGSITKTLIRKIVEYVAVKEKGKIKTVLTDVLATPVSPELLPPKNGDISQKTEDIVGPYVLHDFFLFHFIRRGSDPKTVLELAEKTFAGEFSKDEIKKRLTVFIKRFFSQQFKRSCVPDGIKVGSVSLSPRGDFVMPSDAMSSVWTDDLAK